MKKWSDSDGVEFKNSDLCFGREYKPEGGKIDVAKISIRGRFPASGWGWLEESDEMAVIVAGEGYIESKVDGRHELKVGDVVYLPAREWFRWGGSFDMITPCGTAFDPSKHHLELA